MQAQSYRSKAEHTTPRLAADHRRQLVESSGIDPTVIAERGVRTVWKGAELPAMFSWRQKQRVPAMLFNAHRPDGTTTPILRPDEPDTENPGAKYLQPPKKRPGKKHGGPGNVLDVLERHKISRMDTPVLFTEGFKKADAITSAARREGVEILAASISGTWCWMSEGEPIADMYQVPVEDRRVYIGFDSDLHSNPHVQMAAEGLAEHLLSRGAEVWILYLPDLPDGSKCGCDDFLAAGGSLEELLALARPYSPGDLQRERLSRNERLRRALATFTRRESAMPTKTRRDCSKKAAFRAYLTAARKRGKLVEDGVEIAWLSARTGAELAAMSQPTFSKCTADLIEDGYIRRIKAEKSEQADSYVLLIPDSSEGGVLRYHYGERETEGERKNEQSKGEREAPHGDNVVPPLPELRWSSSGRKPRRGLIEGTRMVRQGTSLTDKIPSKRRPGKKRREILAYLLENGGSATRKELLENFAGQKTIWKDFKKQTLADLLGRRRQYKGQDLSVGPPVIELTDGGIALVEGWQEALEHHRELGGEEEAAIRQKVDHLRQRAGFRKRNKKKADRAPTEEEMAEGREERQKRRKAARLVREGMAAHIVAEDVLGASGFIEDLRPVEDPDPPPEEPELEVHPLACDCLECSCRAPRYARTWSGV